MSVDRSQKKPHDYQVPAGRQPHAAAFSDSDRLMIDGGRFCSAIETGLGARPVDPPPVRPAPPAPRNDTRLSRVVVLPAVCLVVGLMLGIAIGRVTAPEALPDTVQQEAPATPAAAPHGDGNARPSAEQPAKGQAATDGGSADPDPRQPDDTPGQ